MKIQAQALQTGMVIQYGHEKKRVKEMLFNSGMVQLTLQDILNNKKPLLCMNVCMDFEFKTNSINQGDAVK